MMKIPGQYRSELERSLASAKKVRYTFADLDDHMEMFRIHGHRLADGSEPKPAAIAAKVGGVGRGVEPSNSDSQRATSPGPVRPNRGRGRSRGRGAKGRGSHSPGNHMSTITCELCNKNGHYTHSCKNYKGGNDVRQRLKDLGRCDACMVRKDQHPDECPKIDKLCYNCYTPGHYPITCDGEHPGSWLKKKK